MNADQRTKSETRTPAGRRAGLRFLPLVLALLGGAAACEAAGGDGGPARERAPAEQAAGGGEAGTVDQQAPRPPLGRAWVIFGADTVVAEVARSYEERQRGLMYRESVPEGTGMLFVFPEEDTQGFWMQNTYVPLDIAFLDSSLNVVDIQQMEPESTVTQYSRAPAIFALEVREGWFEERGIEVGDQAEIVFR